MSHVNPFDPLDEKRQWWIFVTFDYGRTAMPSKLTAHQGAEVCRSKGIRVKKIRRAEPNNIGDQIAIQVARDEILDKLAVDLRKVESQPRHTPLPQLRRESPIIVRA